MEERDVIVVGSGPAGSSCARALKAEGVDVLVLEKESLPRYKCCSGVLFGQTQELIRKYFDEDVPASIRCAPEIIDACDVREWTDKGGYQRYPWEMDKDGKPFSTRYINIWRNLFDKWLLDRSGAEYRDLLNVRTLDETHGYVQVTAMPNGASRKEDAQQFRCKYLVGADGGNSTIRRLLNPNADEGEAGMAVGILQSYFKLESLGSLEKDAWTVFFLPEVGEMLNCVHQKDEYLLLCVGGFRGRKLRESMAKLRDFLSDRFGVRLGEWWRDEGCQMQLAAPTLGRNRVLLTGEAANFVYLNGEGISAAMDSGYRCGKAIAQALREDSSPMPLYADKVADVAGHVEKCLSHARFLVSQAT